MLNFSLNSSYKELLELLQAKLLIIEKEQENMAQNFAQEIKRETKEILNIPISKNGSKIVRSMPLQAPRKESGNLQNSIDTFVSKQEDSFTITLFCAASAPYALYLEYGTSKVAPRPFMLPVLNKYTLLLKEEIKQIGKFL